MRFWLYVGYGLLGLFLVINLGNYLGITPTNIGYVGQQTAQVKYLLWIMFIFYVGLKVKEL